MTGRARSKRRKRPRPMAKVLWNGKRIGTLTHYGQTFRVPLEAGVVTLASMCGMWVAEFRGGRLPAETDPRAVTRTVTIVQ